MKKQHLDNKKVPLKVKKMKVGMKKILKDYKIKVITQKIKENKDMIGQLISISFDGASETQN